MNLFVFVLLFYYSSLSFFFKYACILILHIWVIIYAYIHICRYIIYLWSVPYVQGLPDISPCATFGMGHGTFGQIIVLLEEVASTANVIRIDPVKKKHSPSKTAKGHWFSKHISSGIMLVFFFSGVYTLSLWHYVCYPELMSLAVAILSNAHPNNTSLKIESRSAPPPQTLLPIWGTLRGTNPYPTKLENNSH